MIELINITKTYNNTITAIKDISLKINDGDIFGIIGLSGAGKSTLVRCINLLEKPTSGEIIVDEQKILNINNKELLRMRKNIGTIFQNFNLLEQRTVFKNVAFPLELNGVDKNTIKEEVARLLKLVDLEDKANSYPSELSGGQKQRVAIARALANSPKYLICDEATSALDPKTTDSILKLLLEINKKFGVTIILISHDMSVIYSICNKVAVLDEAHIVEEGDVEQIFKNPQSDIAKRFIEFKRLEVK
ncbi:MAG: ATP-binding cassette domain-containing protein [Bacilli bacterium]|nr:ATP-binding cassette domain-containing protein [Bacilli bacterium]